MTSNNKILTPLHPALSDEVITEEDCYTYSIVTGISPQIIAGILTGRIRPNGIISERLKMVLDAETIVSLQDDYDPERYMEFHIGKNFHPYMVHPRYYAGLLKPGDRIKTDDERWLVVSGVDKGTSSIRIYSGKNLYAVIPRNSNLVVAVSEKPKDNSYQKYKDDDTVEAVKKYFKDHATDESEIEYRNHLLYKMLEEKRNG